jgi:hypothetical protein
MKLQAMLSDMMKPRLKTMLLAVSLIMANIIITNAHAQMYKGTDAEGNVVYSDKPFADAKQFTPPSITVIDPIKVPVKEEVKTEEETLLPVVTYESFSIATPTNDETIRNVPDLAIALNLSPELNIKEGHSIWLLMDGKPVIENGRSLLMQITHPDRGEHTLQAQVRDKTGQTLLQTAAITVHIKYSVVRRPKVAPAR